jgi:Cu+-exporting ATPase
MVGHRSLKTQVCHMAVDPQQAAGTAPHGGTTFYFCSVGCQSKLKADPKRYLMHPDVEQEAPGINPRLEGRK